jgi:hypothetical protein
MTTTTTTTTAAAVLADVGQLQWAEGGGNGRLRDIFLHKEVNFIWASKQASFVIEGAVPICTYVEKVSNHIL